MFERDFLDTPTLDLGNCANCPRIAEDMECVNSTAAMRREILDEAFDPESEEQLLGLVRAMTHHSDIDVTAEDIRQSSGKFVEFLDNHIALHEESISMDTVGCQGPLRMRAQRDGRVVTATVCMSPFVFDGLTTDEPVHLQRDRSI